ncbi:hypothetical protein SmJEL517_g05937 [Synchytrium microbalum]|uniref:PH domain-containing protein n=1 Tax=Synchytrium microbalum TaxID=1806994 RepID=A0A507BT27_9FUNG|nr:uncharacterized protein SmJEL517_g05937 [Synchytrium microbalum]TPX30518.1 hypothetical protein SmJEL517_g05937 [Synchytrium microbalum]
MQEVSIKARAVFEHQIVITRPGQELYWNFKTVKHNVSFGLFLKRGSTTDLGKLTLVSGDQHDIGKSYQVGGSGSSNDHNNTAAAASITPSSILTDSSTSLHRQPQAAVAHSSYQQHNNSPPPSPSRFKPLAKSHSFSAGSAESPARPRTPKRQNSKVMNPEMMELIAVRLVESGRHTIRGSYLVTEPGTYILLFDNSFSINTSKKLLFFVALRDAVLPIRVAADENLEGWLLKKGNKRLQGYSRRWVRIQSDGMLSYSKKPGSLNHGTVDLARCAVRLDHDHLLIDIDSGSSLYHFKSLSQDEFSTWVAAIQKCLPQKHPSNLGGLSGGAAGGSDTRGLGLASNESLYQANGIGGSSTPPEETNIEGWKRRMDATLEEITVNMKAVELLLMSDKGAKHQDAANTLTSTLKATEESIVSLKRDAAAVVTQYQCSKTRIVQLESALQAALRDNNELRDNLGIPPMSPTLSPVQRATDGDDERTDLLGEPAPSIREDVFFDAEDQAGITGAASESDEDELYEVLDDDDEDESEEEQEKQRPDGSVQGGLDAKNLGLWGSDASMVQRRRVLPAPPVSLQNLSVFGILKNNVGKDLSTISMPVAFNEPINLLQHLAEELEYCELLDRASSTPNPVDRLVLITAFAISSVAYSANKARRKPFNPLLGETYECVRPDKGFRFISEKVSHHPAIMACHAESPKYEFTQDSLVKTKFWGKSVELVTTGAISLLLKEFGERYSWGKPNSCIRNVFSTTGRYTEHYGSITVTNHKTGHYVDLKFKEASMFGAGQNEISGTVYDASGRVVTCIGGRWDENLYKFDPSSPNVVEIVWRLNPFPHDSANNYGFTQFAIELNELTPDLKGVIPHTDTRYRPDQLLYEAGRAEEADKEKERLEQKQREWRKLSTTDANGSHVYKPEWFDAVEDEETGETVYKFNGRYWQERGQFRKIRELW